MTPRDTKLIASIKAIAATELQREIVQLKRRVKLTTEQRDEWRENALRYRKMLLERNRNERTTGQ